MACGLAEKDIPSLNETASFCFSISMLPLVCEPSKHGFIMTRGTMTQDASMVSVCGHQLCCSLLKIQVTFCQAKCRFISPPTSHTKKEHKTVPLSCSERQRVHRQSHSLLNWSATQSVTTAASQTQFTVQILLFWLGRCDSFYSRNWIQSTIFFLVLSVHTTCGCIFMFASIQEETKPTDCQHLLGCFLPAHATNLFTTSQ